MSNVEEFLAHHGVKGMKWGVRNKRSAKEIRARAKRAQIKKRRRTLTDGDIKAYIARLQDERKLKELINEDLSPGRAATKKILSESGIRVAKTVGTGAVVYAIGIATQKKLMDAQGKNTVGYKSPRMLDLVDPKEAAGFVTRGGDKKK